MVDFMIKFGMINEPESGSWPLPSSNHNPYRGRIRVMPKANYIRKPKPSKVCSVDGCFCVAKGRGLCNRHYKQWSRTGKVLEKTNRTPNEVVLNDAYAELIIYDRGKNPIVKTKIDIDDIEFCSKYKWSLKSKRCTYIGTVIDGKSVALHRLLLGVTFDDSVQVDHINRDKLDNRRSNLRLSDPKGNAQNRGIRIDNLSGYKGVAKSAGGRFISSIKCGSKRYHLGLFDTPEEAALAYNEKAKELFGEFAYLNVIPERKDVT